jgi:phage regulator Rha-like protein
LDVVHLHVGVEFKNLINSIARRMINSVEKGLNIEEINFTSNIQNKYYFDGNNKPIKFVLKFVKHN